MRACSGRPSPRDALVSTRTTADAIGSGRDVANGTTRAIARSPLRRPALRGSCCAVDDEVRAGREALLVEAEVASLRRP